MHHYQTSRQVIDHFKDSTLIHAMPHTKNSPLGQFRIFWGLIFIVGVGGLSYQFYVAFTTYYSFPVQVQMLMQSSRSLAFPSVTVCNNNPVKRSLLRCSYLDNMIQVQDKLDMVMNKAGLFALQLDGNTVLPDVFVHPENNDYTCDSGNQHVPVNNRNPIRAGNFVPPPQYTVDSNFVPPPQSLNDTFLNDTENDPVDLAMGQLNVSSGTFYRELLRMIQHDVPDLSNLLDLSSVTEQSANLYGYTAEDFIMECSFDGKSCDAKDFLKFYNRRYGNCFTFNSGKGMTTRHQGSGYGLRLTLNTNISEYIGLLAQDVGIRVAFHQPGTFPFPEKSGIAAAPGLMTTVALTMTSIQRLTTPYPSDCHSQFPLDYTKYLPLNTVYTQMACQTACIQSVMFKECKCVDELPWNGTRIQCELMNVPQWECRKNVTKRQFFDMTDSMAISCDCTPACDEVLYGTTVSTSKWPSPAYQKLKINNFLAYDPLSAFFLGKYNVTGDPKNYEVEEWVPDISVHNNLVRFQTYYQDLNYQLIWEQASYPIDRLFTDIGGIFGLYLGMSLAAMFEIVELVVMLIVVGCRRGKRVETGAKVPEKTQIYSIGQHYGQQHEVLPQQTNLGFQRPIHY